MTINNSEVQKLSLAVKSAGGIVESYYKRESGVTKKADGSLVTQADIESNKFLCDFVRQEWPSAGLVTEELDKEWREYTFAIDPLDGTDDFINGVPQFAVMVGLLHREEPIFGIIFNPVTKELFYGGQDMPAKYIDGGGRQERLQILSGKIEKENILSISSRATYEIVKRYNPNLRFEKCVKSGSEGLRLMSIAQQKTNLRVERRNGIFGQWDVCAPQAILESAGGVVTSLDGSNLLYSTGSPFLQTGFLAADSKERISKATEVL